MTNVNNRTNQENIELPLIAYILLGILIINSVVLAYKYTNFYYFGDMLADIQNLACTTDCDAVMMSEYALFMGIPVPLYGLLGFISILVLFTIYHCKLFNFTLVKILINIFLVLSLLVATNLVYILYTKLELMCKFCMLSHITLALFAFYFWFYYPRIFNK